MNGFPLNARPIWDKTREVDSWRIFAQTFAWHGEPGATLMVSAESTYEIRLNQRRVPVQQLSDFPESRTFSAIDASAFLVSGENRIEVVVHWIGEAFSSTTPGAPYLLLAIAAGEKTLLATNREWRVAPAAMFRPMAMKLNSQLGFAYEFDARKRDTLGAPENWDNAAELDPAQLWKSMTLRSVPLLEEGEVLPAEITQCGYLRREREVANFAETIQRDWLSARFPALMFPEWEKTVAPGDFWRHRMHLPVEPAQPFAPLSGMPGANGWYVIADCLRESVGYLKFDVDAPAGTVIDVTWGEHLAEGRVRSNNGFQFGNRYICCEGKNEFLYPHLRLGCRYVELHFTNVGAGQVVLRYVGLVPTTLPLPELPALASEDKSLLAQRNLAAHTLAICMHEHYEDTPWREQSLYAYDARQQMLYGYYLWGNYDFARASLNLLGESFDGERYIAITAPSRGKRAIPIFTMVWISAVCENVLYSGDDRAFRRWQSQIDLILDAALSRKIAGTANLYTPGNDAQVWNFCEWNGVLSDMKNALQAPYNLYLCEALQNVAKMHRLAGNSARADYCQANADAIAKAVADVLRDAKTGLLKATPDDTEFYEHVQMLALVFAPLSAAQRTQILNASGAVVPLELSAYRYMIDALMAGTPETRRALDARLEAIFAPLLYSDATSIWETRNGTEDFQGCGTLSHAWGAVMPYWIGAYRLGVTPLEPGFARFAVKPWAGELTHLAGEVPTPHGAIRVAWTKTADGLALTVECPAGTEAVIESYPECPVTESTCRNRA